MVKQDKLGIYFEECDNFKGLEICRSYDLDSDLKRKL